VNDKLYVLKLNGPFAFVDVYTSPFTGTPFGVGTFDDAPFAITVDAAGTLFQLERGQLTLTNVSDENQIVVTMPTQGLKTIAGGDVFPVAAAVHGVVPIPVNAFLKDRRVFTALERSVPKNDPYKLCPEKNPNDRGTWRIFAINPEFTNISKTVSLRGLQYVVRTLSGGGIP
jgi:hypothetical protein